MPELTLPQKHALGRERFLADKEAWPYPKVPDPDSPAVQALLAELGAGAAEQVELRQDDTGIYYWALDGVQAKTDLEGGSICLGWRLRVWDKVLLVAEFHAIWVDPDGVPVDTTPAITGDEPVSLFAAAPDASEDMDWDQRPATRYFVLHEPEDIAPLVAARMAAFKPSQRVYEEKRAQKAGKTLEAWIAGKFPADPRAEAIPALIAACEAFDAKMAGVAEQIEPRPDDYDEEELGPWLPDDETDEARYQMTRRNAARVRLCNTIYDIANSR